MKIIINENPMPAVRMTRYGKYTDPLAKRYVQFKESLALELRLHLMASRGVVQGSTMIVEEKIAKSSLPLTSITKLTVKFYRKDQRRCDLDNLLKMAMDLLQTAGIIYNDDQIRFIHAELIKGDLNPRFEMELTWI